MARALRGDFPHPPDLVLHPGAEAEIVAVLDWCAGAGIAAIPYGGGSSVVGGVEPDVGDRYPGAVSIDLGRLDRVMEVDRRSGAARIQAGILGPALEGTLEPHGLTLRHFPQSFEVSSLGGWLATRSGGHHATLHTRIDGSVESMRVLTPGGVVESRRVPSSGAGPSVEGLFLGSEGTLGVIVEAWMRVQERPRFRTGFTAAFPTFETGAGAARALARSGLYPSNCRLLDPDEALISGAGDGRAALLLVAFESADHEVGAWADLAEELCRDHGGSVDRSAEAGSAWRTTFLRAPYLRDALVQMGLVVETFETAVTWDRFEALHEKVTGRVRGAMAGPGWISTRFTHVYPDGPAPYYTVVCGSQPGGEIEVWDGIKAVASDAIMEAGGTITHHHAVGRDHRRWYELERPEPFARAYRAAKEALDPAGVMNPGVLLES